MIYKCLMAYLMINLAVLLLYGLDKWKAKNHRWRVSEAALMMAAVFGVFGAYGGMHLFHHKTQKPKFYIGVPVIFVVELILFVVFAVTFHEKNNMPR